MVKDVDGCMSQSAAFPRSASTDAELPELGYTTNGCSLTPKTDNQKNTTHSSRAPCLSLLGLLLLGRPLRLVRHPIFQLLLKLLQAERQRGQGSSTGFTALSALSLKTPSGGGGAPSTQRQPCDRLLTLAALWKLFTVFPRPLPSSGSLEGPAGAVAGRGRAASAALVQGSLGPWRSGEHLHPRPKPTKDEGDDACDDRDFGDAQPKEAHANNLPAWLASARPQAYPRKACARKLAAA